MLARAGWCEVSREVSSTGSAADEGVQGESLTLTLTLTPTLALALALALTLTLALALALNLALALALTLTPTRRGRRGPWQRSPGAALPTLLRALALPGWPRRLQPYPYPYPYAYPYP